jgi:hypothetical protein
MSGRQDLDHSLSEGTEINKKVDSLGLGVYLLALAVGVPRFIELAKSRKGETWDLTDPNHYGTSAKLCHLREESRRN